MDDLRRLEDTLRQRGITGHETVPCLVALAFIKWYEEARELGGEPHRFTAEGFALYRSGVMRDTASSHQGCTLRSLLADEFGPHQAPEQMALREGIAPAEGLADDLLHHVVFPVLDKHRFHGNGGIALDAVFDAIVHRRERDVRIGQHYTPASIARFATAVVRPKRTEIVLDPAVGAGSLLRYAIERVHGSTGAEDDAQVTREGCAAAGRVFGCDTDRWVASLARMNLYMSGGRADDVRVENGLFLADVPAFGVPLLEAVDACITHPPLGAMSHRQAAAELRERHPGIEMDEEEWLRTRLPVVHGRSEERVVGAGRASGTSTKAGALFLSAIYACLKSASDPAAPAEWRGGRLGIILDEAILNSAGHAWTREYVRRHYYVKAVFSFGRHAFWHEARTMAKMSLLYLVKKGDGGGDQREPTFFAHAERIGIDRRGRPESSDLPDVLDAYLACEAAVRAGYDGDQFHEAGVRCALAKLDLPPGVHVWWPDAAVHRTGARMDYADAAAHRPPCHPRHDRFELGDLVCSVVRHPAEPQAGVYAFATIDRETGEVRRLHEAVTRYPRRELRVVRTGDIVVSGIDLVNGAAGYAYPESDGLVLSREFYTLTLREECCGAVDPRFLALLLRTPHARRVIGGLVTGTSGRTRIQSAEALLALPVPRFPPIEVQHQIVAHVEYARAAEREADAASARVEAAVNSCWKPRAP